ncbi:hypothetical protein HBA54_22440 [Pelagibius litoralis]|uniref:Uncharacterized protein n=1 Tax=Pelagibius litoralis TaxID=374515 RepID=A0A967F1I5_9PROT|nr:hypothetical protein [Pelagibius litoralis]NIA71360.1 hypothetical protein [Pelagibius litoralis]
MSAGRFRLAVAVIAVQLLQGVTEVPGAPAMPPSIDELFQHLGYSETDKQRILDGQIISADVERSRDDQLLAVVALPNKTSISELAATLQNGSNIPLNAATLDWGEVTTGTKEDFARVVYNDAEKEEVDKLLRVKADDSFNFSTSEITSIREVAKDLKVGDPNTIELVNAAYRETLFERYLAYKGRGLDGMKPYDHGGAPLSPAKQLRTVEAQSRGFLATYFPGLRQAVEEFPLGRAPDIVSKIYWVKRVVEGRPAFILIHQVIQVGEDFVLSIQRQFYVGHTYESLQVIDLALPAGDRVLVFSVNRVFTEQIAGFFSGVARLVGQSRTKGT